MRLDWSHLVTQLSDDLLAISSKVIFKALRLKVLYAALLKLPTKGLYDVVVASDTLQLYSFDGAKGEKTS